MSSYEWLMANDTTLRVPCPRCGAEPGKRCRNTLFPEQELSAPAHPQRFQAAKDAEDTYPANPEENS